jgi:hypothetical protein
MNGFGRDPIPGENVTLKDLRFGDDATGGRLITETEDFDTPSDISLAGWNIVLRNGPEKGRRIKLQGKHVVVGRNDEPLIAVDVDLTNSELSETPMISRRHLQIAASLDGIVIKDLGSTNGTFLAGVRLSPSEPMTIERPGGMLRLANLEIEVTIGAD